MNNSIHVQYTPLVQVVKVKFQVVPLVRVVKHGLAIVTTGSTGTIGEGDTFKLTNMECLVAKLHLIKEWTYASRTSRTSRTTGETASH